MNDRRAIGVFALSLLFLPLAALADPTAGLSDHGEDLYPRDQFELSLHGTLRARAELFDNLDLDRGPTPSGRPLFPVPANDPNGQLLSVIDTRARADLAVYAPFATVAVKVRFALLDDLPVYSTPVLATGNGTYPEPAGAPNQLPAQALRVQRAYAEWLTPVGLITAGRQSSQWGLGMVTGGGDCLDCDHGDAADRIAFVTPIAGHLWALAYDFSSVGPLVSRPDSQTHWVWEPGVPAPSVTFAVMNVRNDASRQRRQRANKATFEYGAFVSHRWQRTDQVSAYFAVPSANVTGTNDVPRGLEATAVDAWARLTTPLLRIEAEGALLTAHLQQSSLIPGVLLRDPIDSLQWGAAVEIEAGTDETLFSGGLNGGVASGDPAPGFGAFPQANVKPVPGELDAPQAYPPADVRVDNFRFNPDYRVDRILFAELIGTVTDAMYFRPHVRAKLYGSPTQHLYAKLAATYTRALYAASTPGNANDLGLELHASLDWVHHQGFDVLAEYAVLFPLAGLSNPVAGLTAQPAQLLRLRIAWVF